MRKIIVSICAPITILFFSSCQTSFKNETETENQKISLESYLTKDNYVKLELKKMPSGHLHIFGQLNGVNGNFILDTGAGVTVIEEKSKDKFHMQTKESEEQATGAGGTGIRMQSSEKNILRTGELELKELNLMLMNLDHVNNAFESMGLEKIDGVIGADILTNNKAIIDYYNLILYLKK